MTFEIGDESLPSGEADIEYFFIKLGTITALEDATRKSAGIWHNPRKPLRLVRGELFTTLNPWFAILLFIKEAKG